MSTHTTPARRHARALLGATALTAALLSACGSDSQPSASSAADTTAEAEAPTATSGPAVPADVSGGAATITVTVGTDDFLTSGGTRVVSVPSGTDVTIEITDPAADQEYHLHGYDVEAAAAKGDTATVQFTADRTGTFDLESHDTEDVLLVIVVV